VIDREGAGVIDGDSAALTPTEFRLLYQLALERGRRLDAHELLQKLCGPPPIAPRSHGSVCAAVCGEDDRRGASRHTFIQTRYGVGYKLEAVPKIAPQPASGI